MTLLGNTLGLNHSPICDMEMVKPALKPPFWTGAKEDSVGTMKPTFGRV